MKREDGRQDTKTPGRQKMRFLGSWRLGSAL